MTEQSPKYVSTDTRRREIAAAVRALIVEKGIDGLRTRDVAARVGINIATLHYHVPSKEALLGLVMDTLQEEFIEQGQRVNQIALDPLGRLKLEIAEYKSLLVHKPDLLPLIEEIGKRARLDPLLEPKVRAMRINWHRRFVTILEEGRAAGQFRSTLDPEAGAHIVIGALVSFQYKPRHLLSLFDSVAEELIRSFTAAPI
ncbi:TetR/AcrR family transcriptional regulator [Rhizobium aquaticum]|uniref:TetR/AcrR family transcriptional regulator n=1 Tax=Rhizobium aquaticum TaxID=1549636 RepID=UPI003390A071